MAAIPAIGPTGALTSYWTAIRYIFNARAVIAEGYSKYPNGVFRVAKLGSWLVVVTSPDLIRQISRASEDDISFYTAMENAFSGRHTLGPHMTSDPYHVEVIHTLLTRNYGNAFGEMRDEMEHAFAETIPSPPDCQDWVKVNMMQVVLQVVCRTTNRLFVGLPLCRNSDYIDLNIQYTIAAFKASLLLRLLPESLKGYATRFLTDVPRNVARGMKHLGPLIEEAKSQEETFGKDWIERPHNMVHWLLTSATRATRRPTAEIANRVLVVNFASIHTTGATLTEAIYDLAVRPELLGPLRQEAEIAISQDGWTKDAMGKLGKMDSFLRESLRLSFIAPITTRRMVKRDFTFSDGTFIPQGTMLGTPYNSHVDVNIYPQGNEMDAFKWSKMRDAEGNGAKIESLGATNTSWRIFGHGKHACPGRFFAISELKLLLAHIIIHYDFKMAKEGRPSTLVILDFAHPDPRAEVLFKPRKV